MKTPAQKAYDNMVDPLGAYSTKYDREPQGCSCHIRPPCNYCVSNGDDADAPPILQWDHDDARNPVSWYLWSGGSSADQFGLTDDKFYKVNALTLQPSMWHGGCEHHGCAVLFVIDGAKDSRTPSACLFPEILKAKFHGVRSVIEAYSKRARMEGSPDQSVAGVMLEKGKPWDALVRVTAGSKTLEYRLDRWD